MHNEDKEHKTKELIAHHVCVQKEAATKSCEDELIALAKAKIIFETELDKLRREENDNYLDKEMTKVQLDEKDA